ncbi:hypothetical protein F4782DRAFT_552106 [Xylaria castorea]|nr:hypothetical protein F4782DRAFT_552106 [Xylaria castorea]
MSSSGPQPPTQPLSPWAARHGTIKASNDAVFKRGPVQHSGTAPEHFYCENHLLTADLGPWLGPIFYSDKPRTANAGTFVNVDEIDRLFLSELVQEWHSLAVKSWQIGVVHKTLKFSDGADIPGGHQEAAPSAFKGDPETHPGWESKRLYDDEVIKPNEETWFPFYRRDRWLNWSNNAPVLGGGPWSVDNPLVWEALSVSLECVNRVLRALIHDQHPFMKVLLFGYYGPWKSITGFLSPDLDLPPPFPTATVIISYDRYCGYRDTCDKDVSTYMEGLPLLGKRNMIKRLEDLLATQMWSFHDSEGAYGITYPGYDSVISLHVGLLTQLIEGNITLAERCILQFKLAVVILHEMGHAISNNRLGEACGEKKVKYWNNEPASLLPEISILTIGASEIGHNVDMALWGCVFELGQRAGPTRPPLGLFSQNWPISDHSKPNRRGVFIDVHEDFAAGKPIEKDIVPAEFTSKLLSESFWNDPEIPRKTDNYFHRTRLFTSRTPYEPGRTTADYMNPVNIDQSLDLEQLTQTEKLMVQDWKEREALWDTVRAEWFKANHDIWSKTPWGKTFPRWCLSEFVDEHKEGNIEYCASVADTLVDNIPWYHHITREEYLNDLEAVDNRWIIHAIGLLMMASIPIRQEGEFSTFALNFRGPERWVPSEEAEKAGRPGVDLITQISTGGMRISGSRFVNPFDMQADIEYNHFHFLNMVCEIILHLVKAQKPLSTPWVEEIMRVERILRQELVARSETAFFSWQTNKAWSRSWYFKVPEYRPDSMSRWVGGKWVPA